MFRADSLDKSHLEMLSCVRRGLGLNWNLTVNQMLPGELTKIMQIAGPA